MSSVTRVARPPDKPLLIFDGDCTFCRRWIARWRQTTGDRVDYRPYQDDAIASQFPELTREWLESAVHFVEPDGRVTHGAEAVFRSLGVSQRWPLWSYENIPGFATVAESTYRVVAANRKVFSRITRWLWGQHVEQPTHFLVRWLFLSLVGFTYLIAFLSLDVQLPGLIGSGGITPAAQVMAAIREGTSGLGLDSFHAAPTLCWLSAGDGFLRGLSVAGLVLSVLVILNIAPAPCLFLLWLIYLSLAEVSTVFLGYQWDNLLLETGFLAAFLAPWRLWPNPDREHPPSRVVIWLLRWLLFRLMFSSGAVKLLSGDVTWHDLTALTFHYETQPLPTPLAWYAHQLPLWVQKGSCAAMFFVELIVPWFIFLPRRPRFVACWAFVLLMIAIALTGNYTFFNLLALALCVTLLDDFALLRLLPRGWKQRTLEPAESGQPSGDPARNRLLGPILSFNLAGTVRCAMNGGATVAPTGLNQALRHIRAATLVVLVIVVFGVSSVEVLGMAKRNWSPNNPLVWLYRWTAPFRTVNGYGLFAVMTTSRPEILVEGSNDGQNWLAYEFRYKAGDLKRRPRFVAPHQPRLDWQMWFGALGDVRENRWFVNFCLRLLQGKPEVLALIEKNPFPGAPPKFVRARLFNYNFTTPDERAKDGHWWRREFKGEYCPVLSLPNP